MFECLLCKPTLKTEKIAASDQSLFYIGYMDTVIKKVFKKFMLIGGQNLKATVYSIL